MKVFIVLIVVVGLIVVVYMLNKSSKEKAQIAASQADLANILGAGQNQLATLASNQGGHQGGWINTIASVLPFLGL